MRDPKGTDFYSRERERGRCVRRESSPHENRGISDAKLSEEIRKRKRI
jgi:hypothetical protein